MKAVREFFSGAWSLVTGMRLTLREFFSPTITVHYPHETPTMPKRFRGHIELTRDPETGKALCTACNLCSKACPSDCILVDGVKLEGEKKKSVTEYHLDFTKCSLCGACIEVCPSDAIQFSGRYNLASATNDYNNMDLVKRSKLQGAGFVPKPAAPAPPVAPAAPAAPTPVAPAPVAPAPQAPQPAQKS
jgi:NADH-quinone oxidoreductase subunit I